MKALQIILIFFAVIGCLAIAVGGFFVYSGLQGEGAFSNPFKPSLTLPAQTTATVAAPLITSADPEAAKILQAYQPTPAPTAIPVAGQPMVAGVQPVAGAPQVAGVQTPRPIKTPGPDDTVIKSWPSSRKLVALTYDDGPHPEWTPKLIELLVAKKVKATFFLIGPMIEKHPDIAMQLSQNGFELANHTMTHPDFAPSKWTKELIADELKKTNDIIVQNTLQKEIRFMRPPYGRFPPKVQEVCKDLGLKIITWNIDTNDWDRKQNADDMTSNVMKNISPGSIVLMHDRYEKVYQSTDRIIDLLRADGYEFVTVGELVGLGFQPATAPAAAIPVAAIAAPVAPAAVNASQPLPVPQAAIAPAQTPTATAPPGIDSSKITQPPAAR